MLENFIVYMRRNIKTKNKFIDHNRQENIQAKWSNIRRYKPLQLYFSMKMVVWGNEIADKMKLYLKSLNLIYSSILTSHTEKVKRNCIQARIFLLVDLRDFFQL